ncbi:MAG TPA: Asp23/Gls24 family envelope stress response protein [Candidatus Avacidaminococcus intestinavium]|uniref:Asp23/Gls24 family envelope stress response protein n=1 Tax=Candidatus Avacidaminococcus intestinavium TaxID=2840684 RepID=A0A9D1MQD4_9FIRM|nr:Asp23/Gls24 family envelope stress response protein [Candidatus Avacidaminococcus intestinavium]
MVGGKTIISEEVFADLAKTAMSKVDNVAAVTDESSALAAVVKKVTDRVIPQVVVRKTDAVIGEEEQPASVGHVSFEIKVSIVYGANIPETTAKLRTVLLDEVERITGFQVDKVDVIVEKLIKHEAEVHSEE